MNLHDTDLEVGWNPCSAGVVGRYNGRGEARSQFKMSGRDSL